MNERLKEYNDKMQKSFDFLKDELASIRAGRANPAVLDKVKVDYYGAPTPVNQLAAVSVAEARIQANGKYISLKVILRQAHADSPETPNSRASCRYAAKYSTASRRTM